MRLNTANSLCLRALILTTLVLGLSLPAAALAGGPEVTDIEPTELRRGTTTHVTVTGSSFATLRTVTVSGSRVGVSNVSHTATTIEFDLAVGDRAVAGERDLALEFSVLTLDETDALTIVPGEVTLFDIDPASIQRGAGPTAVEITGLNLDAVSDLYFE